MRFLRYSSLRLALVTLALLALAVPQTASAQPVPTQFTRISVPGAGVTSALSLNDKSQVVGYCYTATAHDGFLYDHGVYTLLDPPTTAPFHETFAMGINNRGQVVGNYLESDPVWYVARHCFLYDHGNYTTFQVPGSVDNYPNGINNQGQVIVTYFDSDFNLHSALYDHGVLTALSPPDDLGVDTEVWGINDRGQVVGVYVDMDFVIHGFL